ncbi:hypothetical protein GWK47_002291 [Chionoecetes opilio]|uniref:Uncharacterized protein n=1 Tax=Chionoecetes opilio TaxID=41210 RepID=A0A8J4XTL4_CHIOP|nr:hypothetical protein GWK47_002291 [Chionoecetes opilio]
MDVKSPLLLQDLDVPGQFRLTKKEERGLQRFLPLVVRSTQRPGLRLLSPVQAPRLDPELIKALGTYDKIDPEIGDVALSKLSSHLWFRVRRTGLGCPSSTPTCPRGPKTPWLRPYDERNLTERTRLRKKVTLPKKSVRDLHPEDFVSGRTLHFFRKLTWMRPSSICHRTRGRWTRGSSGPLRSSGPRCGE